MAFVIRDVIHGDIEFDDNIKAILNCTEFQRLHRIHQLSCEYLVFPTATHTRFSHSIGTYHIMKKLISHFSEQLKQLGYEVSEDDKNLAYLAGLLHDIGHGAFSHTFEKIFNIKSHEQWTIDILSDENTMVHKEMVTRYGTDFLKRLLSIMSKSYKDDESSKIFDIISTLVSSQTDADRMDYLLRDSYFTSVSNGGYDIERLIKSFGVKEEKDSLKIYVNEKYMSTLEEYVMARYFMHKEVYQHNIKQHMESCLRLIFKRLSEIYEANKNIYCDFVLEKLILKKNICVDEYLKMDDNYFIYHIIKWADSSDTILSYLSNCFINRNLYDIQLYMSEAKLKDNINSILEKHNISPIKNMKDEYFYIKINKRAKVYVNTKENIWIKSREKDKLYDLSEKSLIINKENTQKDFTSTDMFISTYLFKEKYGIDFEI